MTQDSISVAESLLHVITGFTRSQVVHVAAQLGLADLLADGPRSVEEMAVATGAHGPSLARLVRSLAALGLVAEADSGRIELTALGAPLRSATAGSVRDAALFLTGEWSWAAWGGFCTAFAPASQRSTASSA